MPTPLSHQALLSAKRYESLTLEGLEAQEARTLFRQVLRLRRIEEALMEEYHPADEMRCPVHYSNGQEAVPAALSLVTRLEDYVFSHHRAHGYYYAKNAPLEEFFDELYGKSSGASGGRAGSQDMSHAAHRFFSGAILAGAASIGAGAAYGIQLQKLPEIVFIGFGEACTEEGAFWEMIELIAAKQLPVVLLCENNRFSVFSTQEKRLGRVNLSEKVDVFGVPAVQIFGNDAPLALKTIREAAAKARGGGGPTFIEAFTYRLCSHVGPEDDSGQGYRTDEELAFWKASCPVVLLREKLLAAGWLTPGDEALMEREIADEIAKLFAHAKAAPFPTNPDWNAMNVSRATPLADQLLGDEEQHLFNPVQADTRITSY